MEEGVIDSLTTQAKSTEQRENADCGVAVRHSEEKAKERSNEETAVESPFPADDVHEYPPCNCANA